MLNYSRVRVEEVFKAERRPTVASSFNLTFVTIR
jgi:hypothetical protein